MQIAQLLGATVGVNPDVFRPDTPLANIGCDPVSVMIAVAALYPARTLPASFSPVTFAELETLLGDDRNG